MSTPETLSRGEKLKELVYKPIQEYRRRLWIPKLENVILKVPAGKSDRAECRRDKGGLTSIAVETYSHVGGEGYVDIRHMYDDYDIVIWATLLGESVAGEVPNTLSYSSDSPLSANTLHPTTVLSLVKQAKRSIERNA